MLVWSADYAQGLAGANRRTISYDPLKYGYGRLCLPNHAPPPFLYSSFLYPFSFPVTPLLSHSPATALHGLGFTIHSYATQRPPQHSGLPNPVSSQTQCPRWPPKPSGLPDPQPTVPRGLPDPQPSVSSGLPNPAASPLLPG